MALGQRGYLTDSIRPSRADADDGLPSEHVRLGGLVRVGLLVPGFEARIAVMNVVPLVGGEDGDHQVLRGVSDLLGC